MPVGIKTSPPGEIGAVSVTPTEAYLSEMGSGISGRATNATLYVSINGDGTDGLSWATAYNTIQAALDAASTDADDCTLICIAPHTTFYNINTTGDPTWTGNYEIIGTHRVWAPIRNSHASATSVMKFTGKVSIRDLAIFQTADINGVIFTGSGFRIRNCGFNSELITGAATSIYIDGSAAITRGGIIEDIQILGDAEFSRGLYINQSKINKFCHMHIHKCLTAIQIADADSDFNTFEHIDIGDCDATVAVEGTDGIAIDIDAGNETLFNDVLFHHNTINVDDEVGDAVWQNIQGEFDVTIEPALWAGVTVATHATADTWTTIPVEVRAAATATTPFKIVSTIIEPGAAEKFRVRFSGDSGATWFDEILIEGAVNAIKTQASAAPPSTDHIFNKGTQIVASAMSESGGNDIAVWLGIQEI